MPACSNVYRAISSAPPNPVNPPVALPVSQAAAPLRWRWERDTRYYEVHVHQDLWGEWVVTRVWGRRASALGQIRHRPCGSYAAAREQLARVAKQRKGRGYALVGA